MRALEFAQLPNVEVIIANSFRSAVTTRPPELRLCRSVFYNPTVASTPRRIEEEVRALRMALVPGRRCRIRPCRETAIRSRVVRSGTRSDGTAHCRRRRSLENGGVRTDPRYL